MAKRVSYPSSLAIPMAMAVLPVRQQQRSNSRQQQGNITSTEQQEQSPQQCSSHDRRNSHLS
mgnify:CR=1